MSDTYAIRRYHRQTTPVVGTTRKKYFIIFGLLLLAGVFGVVYFVYTSGFFAESNPKIAPQLITRINLERQSNNLPPVQVDSSLSNLALSKSKEVKIANLNYAQGVNPNPDETTNVFIIPKITYALSGTNFQQQLVDSLENDNPGFRQNVLNPKYGTIGIGVSSDSYNYYVVSRWK